ncbi:DUF6401 family natural product biosynthesis protein [Catellatospora sp. KI3]|uniref:DUF6401 family natural product biosynthesis protein n=1 Tax=Catellatospora sp. KI3 TaxID=3041620 RepID=UPI0024824025|nr:DUF6401 family natural product biosynthesis protein [Catellatospora sp. KI3]MDI1463150.1 DUF6401 family natural product biosynthesis protein [Catellatospora sp. KI3]
MDQPRRIDRDLPEAELARFVLDRYARRLGDAGRAAAARDAGLRALLDQLTARVGDLLAPDDRQPTLDELASYADGLVDAASGLGWTLPEGEDVLWRYADEITWRLVAVCELASSRVEGADV